MAVKKADPREEILGQERVMQQDMRRLRANYPENAAYIQCYVEDACDRMDYEGSRMYDEHPDKYMMRKVCDSIHSQIRRDSGRMAVESGFCRRCGNLPDEALQDLIEVLFFNEVYRRRCRRRRCRRLYR